MKRSIGTLLLLSVITSGCSPSFQPYNWLAGTWEMAGKDGGSRLETWTKTDRRILTGRGMAVSYNDTTLLESISLYGDHHSIWYTPVVTDQNNQQPVAFKLVSSKKHKYVFENPGHDFPQRITYHFKPLDRTTTLKASIGDTLDVGATSLTGDGIHFLFTRK